MDIAVFHTGLGSDVLEAEAGDLGDEGDGESGGFPSGEFEAPAGSPPEVEPDEAAYDRGDGEEGIEVFVGDCGAEEAEDEEEE